MEDLHYRQQFGEDLLRCRMMISRLISLLERYVRYADNETPPLDEASLPDSWALGGRETMLSALTKLVQLLERVSSLDRQWQEQRQQHAAAPLEAHEWSLLQRYMRKLPVMEDEVDASA